jgi:small-conductance mechanosensitive channel
MRAHHPYVVLGLLCSLVLQSLAPKCCATDEDKLRAAEAKQPDISQLTNEDLLKQANAIFARGSGDYLAAVRALAGLEAQLDDASRQLADLTPLQGQPKKIDEPNVKPTITEDAAKAAVDAAKHKADVARRKLKFAQTRKQLQGKVAAAVEGLQSAAGAFQTALDDLKPYAVEIALRFQDGTMTGSQPAGLSPDALAMKQKQLASAHDKITERLSEARRSLEATGKSLDEAEKAVSTADAEATEAGRAYAREQQRKETAKKYAGKKPNEMLGELDRLVQDGVGLKGAYELAYREFTDQLAEADRLRKELASLKQPEATIPQIARAEDVQQAAKAVAALIGFCTARTQKIEALRAKLSLLARSGALFEADAAVSDDHLFKMQVVAGLLDKAGLAGKLPDQAGIKRLAEAAARAKTLATEVRAATEKAKTDLPALDKALAEAQAARAAAAEQLASLKQTEEATVAAIRFEDQLGKMVAAQVVVEFGRLRKDRAAKAATLNAEGAEFKRAMAAAADARATFAALKDPLLRAAEEQGKTEWQKVLAELRKEVGLERTAPAVAPASPLAEPKKPVEKEKKPDEKEKQSDEKEKKPEPQPLAPLPRVLTQLTAFQQQLAARVRVLDEREEKARSLLTSLDDLDKKATAYARTLADARLAALRLNAAAADIKKRVGRTELEAAKIPEGVTEALGLESRKKLDADSAAVLNALSQVKQERDVLRKPDPQADALKGTTKELLALVGQRIDLLNDLKKLAADYQVRIKEAPPSEQKRLEQTASERVHQDAGRWDWLLTVDKSKQATNLAELLETYYREVVEIENRDNNRKNQKGKIDELIELTTRERAVVLKGAPLLDQTIARLETAREEEEVLTRARLKPEAAEELLSAFQAKTGRVLTKPLPLGETDRAAKLEELSHELFERYVEVEAARKWGEILASRLGTSGLTAEAGVYQDELAELNAVGGANARRIAGLTGTPVPELDNYGTGEQAQLPTTGGEIGKTRDELNTVRMRGARRIGIEIGLILVAAFLLPRFTMFLLRRALHRDESGNSLMVLTAIRAFSKATIWVAAIAMTLSILGFDVTAIIAGLGIGGLAIGLAAQPMISDIIGAVIIFAERRFRIGDVVKLGDDAPARVVGLTWRSTALKNADGLVVSVPNRKVTETTVQNLMKAGHTYDSLSATVTTDKDVTRVLEVINRAMAACENLSPDHGVSVEKLTYRGTAKVVEYRFWWFLKDYENRKKTRDEVFAHIGTELAHENMAGTEVTLA